MFVAPPCGPYIAREDTLEEKWVKKVYVVGYRFWYLGREMIVCENPGRKIFCEYVDNNGIIQSWECGNCKLLMRIFQ